MTLPGGSDLSLYVEQFCWLSSVKRDTIEILTMFGIIHQPLDEHEVNTTLLRRELSSIQHSSG